MLTTTGRYIYTVHVVQYVRIGTVLELFAVRQEICQIKFTGHMCIRMAEKQ
jgi:hypothetical protein